MEDHAGVLAGSDESFVGVEAVGHALLELGEGEVFCPDGGHFESPGVDGAVLFLGEDGLDAGGRAVGAAVGTREFGKEEIPHGGDDGGLDEANRVFVLGDERVDEVDGALGIPAFDGARDFPNDAFVTDGDHESDILDGDFTAGVAEVKVEFLDFVGDLAGFRTGALDEELECFALKGEFFFECDAGHDAGDLFLPAFLGDVNFVVGLVFRVFLGPFAEAADAIDAGGTQEKVDAIREVVLEDFEEVFDPGDGTFGFAGAVGPKEIGPFEPDDLIRGEEAESLQGLNG